jgi:predicted RNA binding protein YcfA (HicA-like mRNA interferase family)
MPKLPRLSAVEAERVLLRAGFQHVRSKEGHRIHQRQRDRVVLPFHSGKTLHPKVVKQVMEIVGG